MEAEASIKTKCVVEEKAVQCAGGSEEGPGHKNSRRVINRFRNNNLRRRIR